MTVVAVLSVLVGVCAGFVACDNDNEKPKTVADIFKNTESTSEFTSYKREFTLPTGWSVYTNSSTKSSQTVSVNSDVGYIASLDAFVVTKDGVLSIVKCNDEREYFEGGMKGMLFPDYIGIAALRVKGNLIVCKFLSGEVGAFDVSGKTVISRTKIGSSNPSDSKYAGSANIDSVIKILDDGLVAVKATYDTKGKSGYTSIYRPTTDGEISQRGALVCRVPNEDNDLSYVKGFDTKYVTVTEDEETNIYLVPSATNGEIKNLAPTVNGSVEDNGKDDYYGEVTYIGDGKFFIHQDWTVSKDDDYAYTDGEEYYAMQRRIYTPDNDTSKPYTDNEDKVFIHLENSYYCGDKTGIDTTTYLKDGYIYASFCVTIVNKVGFYDQFILDKNLNVVMSLTRNYGIEIKGQKRESVGYFDLVMQGVDGYYYMPIAPSEVKVFDKDGALVGENDRKDVLQQELSNNIFIASIQDPDDDDEKLYGAYDLSGNALIPFEYYSLSAYRGAYTIGQKLNAESVKTYYIIGNDGKIIEEMSDGSTPLADMAKDSNKKAIYKIGCYMFKVVEKDADGKDVTYFGIKNFNPNVNKNVVMPATMKAGSVLYAAQASPKDVFVFDKITNGSDTTYTVYRLI